MPTLRFHMVHGSGVNLKENRTVAHTTTSVSTVSPHNSIVFSDRPVQFNEKVSVKILDLNFYGDVRLGFSQIDPSQIPKSFFESSNEDFLKTPGIWVQEFPHLDFKKNSILSYMVNQFGDVTLEIDGQDKGRLFTLTNIWTSLWIVLDLRGHSTRVQLMNKGTLSTWLKDCDDLISWRTLPKKRQECMQITPITPKPQSRTNGPPSPFGIFTSFVQSDVGKRFFGSFLDGPRPRPSPVNLMKNGGQSSSPLSIENERKDLVEEDDNREKVTENLIIRILNFPSHLEEADIRSKFGISANEKIEINKTVGTAKIFFKTDKLAFKIYNESNLVKLGKNKLGWIKPEELYIENVPKNVVGPEILKEFERAKSYKFQNGENGNKIATVIFISHLDQRKAYEISHMSKLGPQRLEWSKESGGGKGAQLKIMNTRLVARSEIKLKFPTAFKIDGAGLSGPVTLQYKTREDAEKAYEGSDLLKLDHKTLGWLQPYELYIQNIPGNIKDIYFHQKFVTAKKLHWRFHPDKSGKRILTVEFANESEQRRAYNNATNFEKIGRQIFGYSEQMRLTPDKEEMEELELNLAQAKKVWEVPKAGHSNISNLFTPAIILSGLPPTVTRMTLMKYFPGAIKINIELMAGKAVAQVEFHGGEAAAHAFGLSHNLVIDGHQVALQPVRVGGSTRRNKILI